MIEHDKSQEVDLLYFLRPIRSAIASVWDFFIRWLRELYRRKWVVIGLLLAAALVGYGLRFVLPKSYKSNAVFISHDLKAEFCSNLVNNLADYVANDNDGLLSKQLNISIETARSIKSLKAFAQGDNVRIDERDSAVSMFRIELAVTDNKSFPAIQAGLSQLLENNDHSLKRKQARLNYLNDLKTDDERKMDGLDSLKKAVNSSVVVRRSSEGLVIDPVSPLDLYKAEEGFYQAWLNIRKQLETTDNIAVLQSFYPPDHPNHPNFRQLFIYVVGAALLLIMIWLAFLVKPVRKS